MLSVILTMKKFFERFTKKNCKKKKKKKKSKIIFSDYFPVRKPLGRNVKTEFHLSNYATKADLKQATGVDTSGFAKKTDLTNLKSDVDKLDIDKLKYVQSDLSSLRSKVDELDIGKLENIPVDLSKLRALIKNDAVKKAEHGELVLIILLKLILRLFKLAD